MTAPAALHRPLSGLGRLGTGLVLGPAGVIGITNDPRRTNLDSDDEDGMDTGIMISESTGGLDEETKKRLEDMSKQIEAMQKTMELLVAQTQNAKSAD